MDKCPSSLPALRERGRKEGGKKKEDYP